MSYESKIEELIAEREQFRNGNTALLEALMIAYEDRDSAKAARCGDLRAAGMLDEEAACYWPALEARKPKQQAW